MQRPQKIEQKVENVKVAKNLLRAKLMLKLRTEKQNKSGFFSVSILLQDKNAYLFEKAPKRGWNPSIQTNPMKTLRFMEISSDTTELSNVKL